MLNLGFRIALVVLDAFVALTAIGGGIAMAIGIDSRVDPAWLTGTLFKNYLIPGLMLAVIVGGSAAIATVATLRSSNEGVLPSLVAGMILIGWIVGEVLILKQPSAPTLTELLYFGIGLMMVALALALWLL